MLFFSVFIFIFGLFVGSFLNCIAHRLHTGESFLLGRSHCPHCKKELKWYDLIPILSFVILKAKCRYCQKPISFQYPLMEIITGLLFVLIFKFLGFGFHLEQFGFWVLDFSFYLLISCFLIIIFIYDLKHYIILDKVLFPAIGITFLYHLFGLWGLKVVWNSEFLISNLQPLLIPILSGFLAMGFFLVLFLLSRGEWMGFGDVKFAFFMGILLGFPNIILALFSAFSIGAIIGVGLILCGKRTMKSQVPFGPFLVAGTFIAMLWGEGIVSWYLSLLT